MTTATATLTEQDVAAIQALRDPWIQACLDRDWDALLSICTSDVTLLPPDAPIAEGREAARTYLEAYPVITKFTVEFTNIDGRGDLATARGDFHITVETDDGEASVDGKFVDTFHKHGDDTWLYNEVIWNSDAPTA